MSIDISYHSFSPSRADRKWDLEGEKIIEDIRRGLADKEDLFSELRVKDIELGSKQQDSSLIFWEEKWAEDWCLKALCKAFSIPLEGYVPTKTGLIKLYAELTPGKLNEAARILAFDTELDEKTSQDFILSFLKEVQPVVKDLKTNDDAMFFRYYWDGDVEPASVELQLQERTQKLFDRYKKNFNLN